MSLHDLLRLAFQEDFPNGDLTGDALVDAHNKAKARLIAKADLIFCGSEVLTETFRTADETLITTLHAKDGARVQKGSLLAEVQGSTRSILRAERTALNIIQYLSGVATQTNNATRLLDGTLVKLLDTRKTPPGMRQLAKYAVWCGGGYNHRAGLSDHILIKENHIAAAGSIPIALQRAKDRAPHLCKIEIEVTSLEEALLAVDSGAEVVMLDNFSPSDLKKAVSSIHCHAKAKSLNPPLIEASGGITMENLKEYALTGVNFISAGFLTHSVKAADISLLIEIMGATTQNQ